MRVDAVASRLEGRGMKVAEKCGGAVRVVGLAVSVAHPGMRGRPGVAVCAREDRLCRDRRVISAVVSELRLYAVKRERRSPPMRGLERRRPLGCRRGLRCATEARTFRRGLDRCGIESA